jgi:hypothetical protein
MFFHIDESGNTGNNLFDANQPRLSYGVLSSRTNVDALGAPLYGAMLSKLGATSLHASQLGAGRLEAIAPHLLALQQKMNFEFGFYVIEKPTYAVVRLFEAVFDAGLNDAVPWAHYWTPLRFYLIHHLSRLVDEPLLRSAWDLSTELRIERRLNDVVELIRELDARLPSATFHARIKEVMHDAFRFGMAHPERLDFGTTERRLVSPNAIGFQFVFAAIARQLRSKGVRGANIITIDHQEQFNASQLETHRMQALIAQGLRRAPKADQDYILGHPLYRHLSREEVLPTHLPGTTPQVLRNTASIGLQTCDVFLWIVNRVLAGEELPPGVAQVANAILRKTHIDGIWMEGMLRRWSSFEEELPGFESLTPAQLAKARAEMEQHRQKVTGLALPT